MQYLKGKSSYRLQQEFAKLCTKYWGRHLWARGHFGVLVGSVNEIQIKQYIDNQSDAAGSFKIWDELEPEHTELESDSSKNSDAFKP